VPRDGLLYHAGRTVTRRQRAFRLAILVAWMALLTVWSDQSQLPIDAPEIRFALFNLQHRLAHLAAFGLLGLLANWAFEGWSRSWLWAIVLTAVFGASDEIHQSWVPGRKAGADDWLFDIFSASLALYLWPRVRRRQPWLATSAPLIVGTMYAVAVVLLLGLHTMLPPEIRRPSIGAISSELVTSARDAARQLRALRSS
jgi:VanZ family protein